MRARLAPADPATNDDALVEHTAPARRRPRRRLWCALGAAAVLAVAVLAKVWVRGEVWLAYVFPTQTVWDRVRKQIINFQKVSPQNDNFCRVLRSF